MRRIAALLTFLMPASPAAADRPLPSVIIAMARHFMQESFMFGESGHYHIEFDVAHLHPQPQANYWAVNTPNTYVAAVRLVCPDIDEDACWRLEKLAINGEVALDRGEPL
jgi:hypothetical protein